MQKGILIGDRDDYYLYEYGISLVRIIDNPDGSEILKPVLMKIAREYRGNSILNSNIPKEILKAADLDKRQSKTNRNAVQHKKKTRKQSRRGRL